MNHQCYPSLVGMNSKVEKQSQKTRNLVFSLKKILKENINHP